MSPGAWPCLIVLAWSLITDVAEVGMGGQSEITEGLAGAEAQGAFVWRLSWFLSLSD